MKKAILFFVLLCGLLNGGNSDAQQCAWARSANGTGGLENNTVATAIVADNAGNVYITGYYDSDTLTFGSAFIKSADSLFADMFLAKYDSSGNLQWAERFGDTGGSAMPNGMAIDGSGNIYLTGDYSNSPLSFGTVTITPFSSNDLFLVKFNTAGTAIWAKSMQNSVSEPDNTEATSVATDPAGNIFVTGYFDSSLTVGSNYLANNLFMGTDVFVAKFDPGGNVLWAKSSVSSSGGADEGNSVATDASGNVLVTGSSTSGMITFGTVSATTGGGNDMFLAKYNDAGDALWAVAAGDSNDVDGTVVATDYSGDVYVTGGYDGPTLVFGSTTLTNNSAPGTGGYNIFLAKYNSSGSVLWAKGAGGSINDYASAIHIDGTGNVYIGGSFTSAGMNVGSTTLDNVGMFLAQYDASGNVDWARCGSNESSSSVVSLTKDVFGNLYTVGYYNSPTLVLDAETLTDPGSPFGDVFTAKFDNFPTGIKTITQQKNVVTLFPNPASTVLTVQSVNEPISNMSISNVVGQIIVPSASLGTTGFSVTVDVSGLPAGVYFVKVSFGLAQDEVTTVRKFVKE